MERCWICNKVALRKTMLKNHVYCKRCAQLEIERQLARDTIAEGATRNTIPEGVTSIDSYEFYRNDYWTEIKMPDSLTKIGEGAFGKCVNLANVIISRNVEEIGCGVFEACGNLTSIKVVEDNPIYDSRDNCNAIIETKANTLIAGCQTTVIPQSVSCIGHRAFTYCEKLTSIFIPKSVTQIHPGAFAGCSSLTRIEVAKDNPVYDSRNHCNAIIETKTNKLIAGCKKTVIPHSVIMIGEEAFRCCKSLKRIKIPDSVTMIEQKAFEDCGNLIRVTIPSSVTTIWHDTFSGCYSLEELNYQGRIIGHNGKEWMGWKELKEWEDEVSKAKAKYIISEGRTSVDDYELCENDYWEEIEMPDSLMKIGTGAFCGCVNFTSVIIPKNVKEIGADAFTGCINITSIKVAEDNPVFDSRDNCNAIIETKTNTMILGCQTTVIPQSVSCIGHRAFAYCDELTSIEIPDGVTKIEGYAFLHCEKLTRIFIPKSVTCIEPNVFALCSNLVEIEVAEDNPVYDSRDNCNGIIETKTNKLIAGCKNTVIPNSVTTIGKGAFYFEIREHIKIPGSVTTNEGC